MGLHQNHPSSLFLSCLPELILNLDYFFSVLLSVRLLHLYIRLGLW